MAEQFWRCLPCDTVVRLTASDGTPQYDLFGGVWVVTPQDERAAFLETHRRHLIELLTQVNGAFAASGPLWDPLTVLWWEVSNGGGTLVIEGCRPTAGAALSYRSFRGRLRLMAVDVAMPRRDLAAEIDAALFPHVLPEAKLAALVAAAEGVLAGIDAAALEVLHESPTDPGVSFARLPRSALGAVAARAVTLLQPWECERLRTRLDALHAADRLPLLVTRQFAVDRDA